jgi:ketosteroid isomerase-like protein
MVVSLAIVLGSELVATTPLYQASADGLRKEVDTLLAAMVSAFKSDPGSVGAFYTDAAAVVGGGQRYQGRASIDKYWKGTTGFAAWTLDTLETGGPADAPWAYGRSILVSNGGQKMETYFVGLLRRTPSGELKFAVDAFTRQRGDDGGEDAGRAFAAYLAAVEKADAGALRSLLDDAFVIVSGNTARDKAGEIADLVPQSGATVEYFRSEDTRTRGFGALAVTTGVLKWKFAGREFQRNHSTIAIRRGAEWKIRAQQVTPRS